MSAIPPKAERSQIARPDEHGRPTFDWTLTSSAITDTVKLIVGPFNVLPVVFVPGIMGSNLKSTKGEPVWRLDATASVPFGLVTGIGSKGPGARQKLLHPDRCVVDDGGALPSDPGIKMGMKGQPFNAERQPFESISSTELIARGKFLMPVYAAGYNWLASNADAAGALRLINRWPTAAWRRSVPAAPRSGSASSGARTGARPRSSRPWSRSG